MDMDWMPCPVMGMDGALVRGLGPLGDAEHPGLARAVDVGVEKPHLRPFGGKGEGEVDRDRRLPDAPLARSDRDDGS